MPRHGLGDPARAALAERDLDGHVAIHIRRLDLRDAVAGAIDHGHRDRRAVIAKDAHHADLAADETETHEQFLLYWPRNLPGCRLQWAGPSPSVPPIATEATR